MVEWRGRERDRIDQVFGNLCVMEDNRNVVESLEILCVFSFGMEYRCAYKRLILVIRVCTQRFNERVGRRIQANHSDRSLATE